MTTAAVLPVQPSISTQSDTAAQLLARVFAGMSDPTRLRILLLLLERERNVSELVEVVGTSQGRVSMHLQCLRWCGFVTSERRGKFVYYRVCDPRVRQLIKLAQDMVVLHGEQLATCSVLNTASEQAGRQ
jgi:DNA-binding transcriptional ArsR family regulator